MPCTLLNKLFGRDTRPAQVINVIVSILWFVAFLLHLNEHVEVELPKMVVTNLSIIGYMVVATVLFGLVGLFTKGRPHQVFKSFGLVLGALVQAVLANGYVTDYPPLDMLIVVCTGLSIWFLLAAFYIFKCEGINE